MVKSFSGFDNLPDQVNSNVTQLAEKVSKGDIYFNVKDYGAKGDGVTDDTSAIINAITATNGRNLYFPKGTYLVSSTINVTCSLTFEDSLNTYLIPKVGVTISPVIKIDNQTLKSFINVTVSCSSRDTVNQDGIQLSGNTNRIYVNNMRAYNLNGHGIRIDTVWDSHFEKLHVESCGSVSFSKEGLWIGATTDTCNQNTFISIQTEKCFYYGLAVQDTAYSNRFIGIHAEWNTSTTGNFIRLGGYRNQYYGSGHLGANYEKVYVGGENNIYDGIFFDSPTVEGTSFGNGYVHKMSNCSITTYNQLGGTQANFVNCDISTLVLNGNGCRVSGGTIGTITHTYTNSAGYNKIYNCSIQSITQNGSGSANLWLFNCDVANAVTFNGRGVKLHESSFSGLITFSYLDSNPSVKRCSFNAGFTQSGNNSNYSIKFKQCDFVGNVTLDNSSACELHLCSVMGNASGDSTSKLIKTYVSGTTGSLSLVA